MNQNLSRRRAIAVVLSLLSAAPMVQAQGAAIEWPARVQATCKVTRIEQDDRLVGNSMWKDRPQERLCERLKGLYDRPALTYFHERVPV